MKKFMALPIAIIATLTVTGCSSKPAETTAAGTTAAETAAGADTTTAELAAEKETSAAISGKRHIINTSTTFAPFESENGKEEMVGIDLDILQAITQDQGFEYEAVPAGFSVTVTTLKIGKCDGVIAGMSIIDKKVQKYDFPEPCCDSGVDMTVLSDSDITSYDQLKDQKIAAEIGTEERTFAESIAKQYSFEVIQYESPSGMYQAVMTEEAVACFEDYPVIGYEISRGLGLALPIPMERDSSYGFATLESANSELAEMFNKGLEDIKASDRYGEILNTYTAK